MYIHKSNAITKEFKYYSYYEDYFVQNVKKFSKYHIMHAKKNVPKGIVYNEIEIMRLCNTYNAMNIIRVWVSLNLHNYVKYKSNVLIHKTFDRTTS